MLAVKMQKQFSFRFGIITEEQKINIPFIKIATGKQYYYNNSTTEAIIL